jgi:error-prone DNA polymerase
VFSELLARSSFSFLRGASQPAEMVDRAKALGLPAIALCDRDGLYGAVRAFARAREIGLRLIVGAELSLAPPGVKVDRSDPWRASRGSKSRDGRAGGRDAGSSPLLEAPTVNLLAIDHTGYTNLCRLLTHAHSGLPKGEAWLELDVLATHHTGLVAVVPGPSGVGAADAPSDPLFGTLVEAFGTERRSSLFAQRDPLRFSLHATPR